MLECSPPAVAIVGLGCRLPGADSPVEFWKLLCGGSDAIRDIPPDRPYYHQPGEFGRLITTKGGFVEHLQDFDPYFFGISPREAVGLDPQQRFLLEAAWRAAEDAGITAVQLQRGRTGVFVGLCSDDYHHILQEQAPDLEFQASFSSLRSNGSGRISQSLGLSGPSITIDTACSSSLVCVHLAVRSIQAGDCELAFAGGANALLNPFVTRAFMRGGLLSAEGKCQTFSDQAHGFVRSEGAGMVLLKPLARALADRDRIYAVIRGCSVNNDGATSPFLTPSHYGQVQVIRAACAEANISPADLAYVEAHGTGTPTGDPIEVSALAEVMAEREAGSPLPIGSCKTNIGHLEGAAGIAGLMKTALAVHHGMIPPSIHASGLNSKIAWSGIPVSVQRTLAAWPEGRRRLAGVSSFGITGTNAHVVLEGVARQSDASAPDPERTRLLPVSARDELSLREVAAQWKQCLLESNAPVADLCHMASLRRTHFEHRLVIRGRDSRQLAEALSTWLTDEAKSAAIGGRVIGGVGEHQPVFVFSGVGSHWVGMGRELYDRSTVFRESFQQADEAIAKLAGWSVLEELLRNEGSSRLDRVEIMQPAIFALQTGLSALWKSWGVEPGVVVGHSLGEIAAAQCSGALSLDDAALVVLARSELMSLIGNRGAMLACGLSPEEGEKLIDGYRDRVAVGVISGRRSIVLSGERTAIDEIARKIENTGVFCRRIKADVATHSPLMDPLLAEFERRIAPIRPRASKIPLYSTVTGAPADGADLTPAYWVRNLRACVIFGPAMERILERGERLFIEISPHPLLLTPMQHTAAERSVSCTFIPSMRRQQDSEGAMLEAFSQLHGAGYPVDWRAHSEPDAKHADVPGHPFRRERVWADAAWSSRHAEQTYARMGRPAAHPLLPLRFDPAGKPGVHVWEGTLDSADHPFLVQHLAQGQAILPGAMYYEMAYAIGTEILGPGPKLFRNVQLRKAVFLSEGASVRIQAVLAPANANSFKLLFFSAKPAGEWEPCCEMTLHQGDVDAPPAPTRIDDFRQSAVPVTSADFYGLPESFGLAYGPLYRGIHQAWHRGAESVAELQIPESLKKERGFKFHPAFLDSVLQLPLLPISFQPNAPKVVLPAVVEEIYFARPLLANERTWAYCRAERLKYDAALIGEDGTVLVDIRGTTCRGLDSPGAAQSPEVRTDWMYRRNWEPAAIPEYDVAPGRWLIFGGLSDAGLLGRTFELHGQTWKSMPIPQGPVDSVLKDFAAVEEPSWRGIVYIAPAEENSDPGASQKKVCGGLLELIQSAGRAIPANPIRSFVVTRGANAIAAGEQGHVSLAPLLGLARAAANEFPRFQVTRLDLDPDSSSFDRLIPDLLGGCVDQEVAYRGERRYVPRIGKLEFDRLGLRRKRVRLHARTDRSYKVVSSKPGTLDRVTLEIAERRAPRAGEIEIRVAGAGLNFLDVLRSLNLGPGQRPGPATFGMELSGEVTRVGENGAAFQPGQRVMALADFTEGCFQAYATIRDRLAFSVPPEFSMEQSAGCLVPYQTAWYALVELGRMRAGDKVLIHAAAGGVGLAAVHIAQLIGAEIFATAGSPEKREYLSRLGVPHVMDSRTLEFSEQVLTATAGRGVDLVLNSISGEAIPKSLATLAMGGRFLEIGKRDIYANSAIDLLPFRRNLSFHAVDMLGLMGEREDMVLRVTREVVDRLASGELPPLPFTAFPASRARDAFHYMAQSKQIGKVIVTFEETEVEAEIPEDRIVRPDASYLITGGLAGIGLECARWLAGRGARHLALVARRKPNASELDAIAKLRGAGVEVMTAIQDVADRDGVRRLIDAIDRDMPPLAGVIHSAGIARDGILERLSWDQFQEVFAPKLEGSWNLHNILLDRDLDFFVLFSSVASWLGSAGQANYAAANAFLDSLGEHRERRGLPVLVVNWGPWTGLGMLERHKLQPSPIFGEQGIRPEQGIACLSALLTKDCAQATVMSADWTVWRQSDPALAANPLFANLRNEMGAQSADREPADSLAVELAGLLRSDGVALIRGRLTKEVVRVLRVSEDRLDAHTSLQRFGLDSLMAVELSNRIQETLGAQVPVMALLNGPSIEELATALYGRIGVAAGVEPNQVSHDSRAAPMILVRNRTRAAQIRQDSCVIQEDGSQLPLFFLGGLPEWTFIAQQLGEDQPLIGVVPRHIHSEGRPRIADFAASVVSTIRQHQPEGPYRLAGWSIGGLIAFEAAQQLIAAGDDVQSLTIVDTFLPLASRKLVGAQKFTAWARLERKRLMYHLQKLRHAELTADYVRQRFGSLVDSRLRPILASALGGKKPVGDVRSSKELHDLIMAASMTYEAQSYAGRVLLCAAADRPIGPEWDYVTAWKSVLTGDVEVEVAEGNHLTMFDPENVQPLVDKLRVHLSVRSTVLGHKAG